MTKNPTVITASVVTWVAGLAMIFTGREIAGAIVLSVSLVSLAVFEWLSRYTVSAKEIELRAREEDLKDREQHVEEFYKSSRITDYADMEYPYTSR